MHKDERQLRIDIDAFINLVMCRRDINAHKAWKLYESNIRPFVKAELDKELNIEYSHYWHTGESTPDDFGKYLKSFRHKVLDSLNHNDGDIIRPDRNIIWK